MATGNAGPSAGWATSTSTYPSSPLTHPDGKREEVQPGQRAPDLEVTSHGEKTRLYEVLRRGRHVLLISDPESRRGPAAENATYGPTR